MEQPKFHVIEIKTGRSKIVTKTWIDIAKKHGFIKDYDIVAQVGQPSVKPTPEPAFVAPLPVEIIIPEKNTPETIEKKKKGRKPKQKQ